MLERKDQGSRRYKSFVTDIEEGKAVLVLNLSKIKRECDESCLDNIQ